MIVGYLPVMSSFPYGQFVLVLRGLRIVGALVLVTIFLVGGELLDRCQTVGKPCRSISSIPHEEAV